MDTLIEDLKNGIREEQNKELKEEIFNQYRQCSKWDNARFGWKKSRFELANFDNGFVQDMLQKYDILYVDYLRFYCEVRNDEDFYSDKIEDIEAFIDEKLKTARRA
jgi:hypothetical protein